MADITQSTYVGRCGRELDIMMNVVLFDGENGITVSEHSAEAMEAGKHWGCLMCKLLSALVQTDHCQDVLAGQPVPTGVAIKALVLIVGVFAILGFGIREVIHLVF
jgi:hypothetical protein